MTTLHELSPPEIYERFLTPPIYRPWAEELGALLGEPYARPVAWSMPLEDEKRRLLADAGFDSIQVRSVTKAARFPSAMAFTECFIAGASRVTRQALSQVAESEREGFVTRVVGRLKRYEADGRLVVPMECHLGTARRP